MIFQEHPMNDSTSPLSLHTRPNRAARRFALSSRRRRKGQALILAVLIMLMVAVLSAGFLLVVSGNLNQTARVTDKTRAVESARSGLKFVNEQLTYSQLGENWRPGFIGANAPQLLAYGESQMPQPGDADFDLYYSSVDKANNWAGSFAKFPNPLDARSDAPQYLTRVERVVSQTVDPQYGLPTGDPDLLEASKLGMLRITVIGLSNDDPAAYSKVVAYKGGQSSPFGRVIRTVGNWDFNAGVVPSATADYNNTAQTLTLSNHSGSFPAVPFNVMIGNAGSPDLGSAVVDYVLPTGELHLASPPFGADKPNVRVELAAQIGGSLPVGVISTESAVDYNLDGTISSNEIMPLSVSQPTNAGGARVNGGLALVGGVLLPDLDPNAAETVRVSGLMLQTSRTSTSKATISTSGAPTTPIDLADGSNVAGFPGASVPSGYVVDGADRLQNNLTGDRTVQPFTPPNISSAAGASRYRQLTRGSQVNLNSQLPALPIGTPDSASNYGYGQGIYINNPSDRERIWNGTRLVDMTQKEMVQMWLSRTNNSSGTIIEDTTDFCRKGTPVATNLAIASLEQQHLRGWVGPDEFHARGALVELFNDPADGNQAKIAVTLDSRSDNSTSAPNNAYGDVPAKAWKDATGATQTGVYRQIFPWPANGVIFGEGNIRVRGTLDTALGDAPRSLTIVSQNNIYVDGSLGAGTKKILLLATKNVVANPTQAIFRPDVQTVSTQGATLTVGIAATLTVADASDFKPGDVVETATSTTPAAANAVALVQSISGSTLSLSPMMPGAIATGDVVRTRLETVLNGRSVIGPSTVAGVTTGSPYDAIQRRVQVSDPTNLRLTFDHSADRLNALTVGTQADVGFTHSTNPIYWTFKRASDTSSENVIPADKSAIGSYTSPTTGTDTFPTPTPTPADNNDANTKTVATVAAEIAAVPPHLDAVNGISWHYTATSAPAYGAVPLHYLAAIYNRQTFGTSLSTLTERRVNIKDTPHQMIMATSVTPFWNGGSVVLDGFDISTATPPVANALQIGFSPNYFATATIPIDPAIEDALTSDENFYQTNPNQTTLDSRFLSNPASSGTSVATKGINSFSLHQPVGLTGIAALSPLPQYRMGRMKLEQMNTATSDVTPGYVMNINAFVYAQKGSWFVIPNALFDKSQYIGATAGTSIFDSATTNDLNRNGRLTDAGEADARLRYSRANYRVNFTGAIAENQTAIVNPIINTTTPAQSVMGAVQAWSNDWANYKETSGNVDPTTAAPGVTYNFDSSYANNPAGLDAGFVMPQSEQLTYVE